MKPSIGRIVHYVSDDTHEDSPKECRAAIVTARRDNVLDLAVFNLSDNVARTRAAHGSPHEDFVDKIEPGPSGRTPGTWHWPEEPDDGE